MGYVCKICVVIFSFVKLNEAILGPMPPQLLEKVLKQVNTLLGNVSRKIATEKKLLIELENESKLDTKVTEIGKPHEDVWGEQDYEIIDAFSRPANNLSRPSNATILKTVPDPIEFEPDPFDTIVFDQGPEENTTTTTVRPVNATDVTPEKKSMMYHMKKINVGYCYGAVIGVMDILMTKHANTLRRLINALAQSFSSMVSKQEFRCVGNLVTEHMNYAISLIRFAPILRIQGYAEKVSFALKKKVAGAYPNAHQLLMKYDGFFNAEEGNNLIASVVKISRNKDDSAETALKLTREFLTALIAPTVRLCETNEMRDYMTEVDKEYNVNVPYGRSIHANNGTLNKSDVKTGPIPPSKSIYDKDFVMQFGEVVHAFIIKYENLFKDFAKEQNYVEQHDMAGVKNKHFRKSA